jgi:hypothetical protein
MSAGKTADVGGGPMCSGCSGDYAGDFEDPGEPAADSGDGNRPTWTCGGPQADGNRLEGEGSFEAKADSEWNSQSASLHPSTRKTGLCWGPRCLHPSTRKTGLCWGPRCLPGSGGESAGEICEIMVSATRIVEIRVITANSEEIKGFRQTEVATAPKRSKASSTKYYQTRGSAAASPSDRVQLPCCRRVAVSGASAFQRWVRWLRKALGQSGAKNF